MFDPNVGFDCEFHLGSDVGFRLDVHFCCNVGVHVEAGVGLILNFGFDVDDDSDVGLGFGGYY